MTVTARSKVLRDETCIKSLGRIADQRTVRKGLTICLERAKYMTDVFRQTEGEPMCIRRAKGLASVLDNMTLFTRENELLVGCFASSEKALPTYPELYWRWLEKAVDNLPDYAAMLPEGGREQLREIHQYWKPFAIHGREREYIPPGRSWRIGDFISGGWMWQWEISTPDYKRILSKGLNGIIADIDAKLAEVMEDISLPTPERMHQVDTLRAMKISTEAAARWGRRYADMLRSLREKEANPNRQQELDKMIITLDHVPAAPARNLHEALQCFILITFIVNYIDQPQVGNGVRFDDVFGPYYEKDIQEGVLTREKARELVEAVWVKMQEGGYVQPPQWVNNGGGGLGFQTITFGGTDANGEDATNELTHIGLEVTGTLQTIAPQVAVRIHDRTPPALYDSIFQCVRTGCSQPAIFNDNVNVPRLEALGAGLADARCYSINNCMQPVIPGKNIHYRAGHSGGFILPMCLTLALSGGRFDIMQGKLSGKRVGYPTPDISEMKTFDDIWDAFCRQVEYAGETLTLLANIADQLLKEYVPRPFLSALLAGNIEKACDMRDWEYLGLRHHLVFGVNNAAEGLCAIKKLVFDEKRLTLDAFVEAVEANFDGDAINILKLINDNVPRFGNDEDAVDQLTVDIMRTVKDVCDRSIDIYGKPYVLDGTTASAPIGAGMLLNATFDGRKSHEPFHDGSISPVQGRDTSGPTATIRSVAKVNPHETGNLLLNQKFMPEFFDAPNYPVMKGYLETLKDLGIHHVQFNCVDRQTLEDAKQHPERYQDLIVRVAGYSAYFVDLDNRMQDEIITRTEQRF